MGFKYRNASFIADNRVMFNIHGNKYRLIVALKYEFGVGYIRFIGTHKQYKLKYSQHDESSYISALELSKVIKNEDNEIIESALIIISKSTVKLGSIYNMFRH